MSWREKAKRIRDVSKLSGGKGVSSDSPNSQDTNQAGGKGGGQKFEMNELKGVKEVCSQMQTTQMSLFHLCKNGRYSPETSEDKAKHSSYTRMDYYLIRLFSHVNVDEITESRWREKDL